MSMERTRWRINPRAVIILGVLSLLGFASVATCKAYQNRFVLKSALLQSKALCESGEFELALLNVNQYLAYRPDDRDALRLKARVLTKTPGSQARVREVIGLREKLLALDPDGPEGQENRRRLAELYLILSDMVRQSRFFRDAPELAWNELRYHAAERVARELIRRGAEDVEAHRLLASSLEGRAVPGEEKALAESIREYEFVLEQDPGDLVSAERLAGLYRERMKKPEQAERVLDALLVARPASADVHLIRYRHFDNLRQVERSRKELLAAAKLAPDKLEVRLTLISDALQVGDSVEARRQLAQIPESSRTDPQVVMIQGRVDLAIEHPENAVEGWRRGLARAGGSDLSLTWWSAYMLLQMGRLAEGQALLEQCKRLAGEDAPMVGLLSAIADQASGRLTRAVDRFERLRSRLDREEVIVTLVALGRCYLALGQRPKALAAFREACRTSPEAVEPRLEIAKLVADQDPAKATEEIEQGLRSSPNDPTLLVALARYRLLRQARQSPAFRSWDTFDGAMRKAAEVAPSNPQLVLMRADRELLSGRLGEATRVLEQAAVRPPETLALATALASALGRAGQAARALQVLDDATSSDSIGDRAELRIARARILVDMGHGRDAREQLGRGIERLPAADQSKIWAALSQIAASQGDYDAARGALDAWSRSFPDDTRPVTSLIGLAIDRGDHVTAHGAIEGLLKLVGPDSLIYRLARGQELRIKLGATDLPEGSRAVLYKEARDLIQGVLMEAPDFSAIHLLNGEVLEQHDDAARAIEAYRRAMDLGDETALPRLVALLAKTRRIDDLNRLRRDRPSVHLDQMAAESLLQCGDKAEAARVVARMDPGGLGIQAWRARMFELAGRIADAEDILADLAERGQGDPTPWLTLFRFQAKHHGLQAASSSVTQRAPWIKSDRPELVLARCRWAIGDDVGADAAFRQALGRSPEDPEVLMAAAEFHEAKNRLPHAEDCLRKVVAVRPEDRPARRRLALLWAQRAGELDAWDRAWSLLGPEDSPIAADPEERLVRAMVLARSPDSSRRERTVGLLLSLIDDLSPGLAMATAARDFLARFLLDTGRPDRAVAVIAPVADQGSDPVLVALYIQALIDCSRLDTATRQLDRLDRISPRDARIPALRSLLISERALASGTPEALERAYLGREDQPESETLGRATFANLVKMGPRAADVAERLGRRLAARNPALFWMPARILLDRGQREAAGELCLAAAKSGGGDDVYEAAAVALAITQDPASTPVVLKRASEVIAIAAEKLPTRSQLLLWRARVEHMLGRYAEEERLCRTLLAEHPENPIVLNNLAWALSEGLNRPAEAIECIDKALKWNEAELGLRDTRGLILTRLGRRDEAIREFVGIVKLDPSALYQFHLALAYHRAGRSRESREALGRARQAGLAVDSLEPGERAEFESLARMP